MKLIMESWRRFATNTPLLKEGIFDWRRALGKIKQFIIEPHHDWESAFSPREWKELESKAQQSNSDFPADGVEPIDPDSLDTHPGGPTSMDIPTLNPPDDYKSRPRDPNNIDMSSYKNTGAPIKNRNAIEYDPQDWESDEDARIAVDRGFQQKLKSDRDLYWSQTAALGISAEMTDEVKDMETKLTELEGANTITPEEAERHRERMEGWYSVLGNLDTIDENIFKVAREINDMYVEEPGLRNDKTEQDFDRPQNTIPSKEKARVTTQVGYPTSDNQKLK